MILLFLEIVMKIYFNLRMHTYIRTVHHERLKRLLIQSTDMKNPLFY